MTFRIGVVAGEAVRQVAGQANVMMRRIGRTSKDVDGPLLHVPTDCIPHAAAKPAEINGA